jgi:hypothetical protein
MKCEKLELTPPFRNLNTSSEVQQYRFKEYYLKHLYVTAIGGAAAPATSRLSSSAFRCRSSVICKEDS